MNNYKLVLGYVDSRIRALIDEMFLDGLIGPNEHKQLTRTCGKIKTFDQIVAFSKEFGMDERKILGALADYLDAGK